jgi:dynein intermediate chain 2, axonemal
MDIQYVYTKKRSEFGRQVHFTDRTPEIIADIQPIPELAREYIARNPVDSSVQNVREFSEHWVGIARESSTSSRVRHSVDLGEHRSFRNGTSRRQSC